MLTTFLPLNEGENTELAEDIGSENEWEVRKIWDRDAVQAVMGGGDSCYSHHRGDGDKVKWRERNGRESRLGWEGEEPMYLY